MSAFTNELVRTRDVYPISDRVLLVPDILLLVRVSVPARVARVPEAGRVRVLSTAEDNTILPPEVVRFPPRDTVLLAFPRFRNRFLLVTEAVSVDS
jgi:hypothetical protein